jgi:esterase/lipase superfamily enzyme
MIESSPLLFNVIVSLVGLLLYAFLWRVTRDLPMAAKVFSRIALALVVVVPLLLAVLNTMSGGKSGTTQGTGPASPTSAPTNSAEVPPIKRSRPEVAQSKQAPATPTPEGSVQVPAPLAKAPAPAPVTGGAAPPTAPVAIATPAGDFDTVPVFFGTDRANLIGAPRLTFDSNRGKRLELGRALVTVPRIHEVPNIERPWAYRLPLTNIVLYTEAEDPKKHFTVQELKSLSEADFLEFVQKRLGTSATFKDHAVVFVHGFNNSFDGALYRTAQIAYDLKFDGVTALYSWPSKGQVGLADYGYDRDSAGQAEPYLKQFLELLIQKTGAKSLSLIAHSMGSQLLLPVLKDLKQSLPPGVQVSQIILAAPDVDRDRFELLANEVKAFAKGVTLYAASNDRALNASMRLAGGVPRAGDVPAGGPLVIAGIDTIDVTATSTDILGLNHSGYAEKSALLADIQLIIQTGERPPEKRVPGLERVPTPKGDYWRFPALR